MTPWLTLSKLLSTWLLSDTFVNLQVTCFAGPIEIIYERKQGELFLLRMSEKKSAKTAVQLQEKLPITKRESEVLYWVSKGKTSWEISQILEMSPRTVNKHLEQIYKKLGVDNRTSAAAISIRILEQ